MTENNPFLLAMQALTELAPEINAARTTHPAQHASIIRGTG